MENPDTPRPCPDCKGTLHRIRLLGGQRDWLDLRYGEAEAPPGILGNVRLQGKVFGMMCSDCSRIFLYGDSGLPENPPPPVETSPEEW